MFQSANRQEGSVERGETGICYTELASKQGENSLFESMYIYAHYLQSLDKSAHVFELAGATVERCTDDVLRRLGDVPSALRFISQNIREADHSSSESFESGNIRPDGLQAHLIIISAATDAGEPWCTSLKKASKEYV